METNFHDWLNHHHACGVAKRWAAGKDIKTIWETCSHGDWLTWLLVRTYKGDPHIIPLLDDLRIRFIEGIVYSSPTNQQVRVAACMQARRWLNKEQVSVKEMNSILYHGYLSYGYFYTPNSEAASQEPLYLVRECTDFAAGSCYRTKKYISENKRYADIIRTLIPMPTQFI